MRVCVCWEGESFGDKLQLLERDQGFSSKPQDVWRVVDGNTLQFSRSETSKNKSSLSTLIGIVANGVTSKHIPSPKAEYCFDYVFDNDTTSKAVYEKVKNRLLRSIKRGFENLASSWKTASTKSM